GALEQPFGFTGREFDPETGLYFYRARYYDPMEGRFISKDPLGFAAGDVNLFGYVQNNPENWIDPLGLWRAIVSDRGGRNGITYGGKMLVIGDNGKIAEVNVSSWPNPTNANPGIRPGTYSGYFSATGHKRKTPAIRLENAISTLGPMPNPNNNNLPYADWIQIHCGYSETNRGSAGCITIEPGQCNEVWNILQEGENGTINLIR
ncbi:MAG: RHS repeat-associated core domain-containing protein, partial [Porticoccaceae bacterium]|nr:RHS repeat-associated core domain-containing protein [Porticoccaceae bacterium]